MINTALQLHDSIFAIDTLETAPTRDGYGRGVVEAAKRDERIMVLCADLTESTRNHWFAQTFPKRFIEMGIAEQNLAAVGAGLATYGKIPFIASYAAFSPGRNWEQIRTTAALNHVPVKVIGAHAGLSVGPDGATHQALEDIALMRVMPHMVVVVPADVHEARKATLALAKDDINPGYLRLAREKSPVFTTEKTPFEIGKAQVYRDHDHVEVALIACGALVHSAMLVADALSKQGIEAMVINNHTIKPLDEATIIEAAKRTNAVVTIEEHQIAGGLGSAVAETLSKHHPTRQAFIGIADRFGQSGAPSKLYEAYGLDVASIQRTVLQFLKKA